ncbi:MAG: HAMP domain-containing protein [Acidobacteria bacterium]|nr:MAG: HAMP domain-containing protein [Acidobacteriota bacterium]
MSEPRRDPRLKDNRFIVGGMAALLVVLTLFYYLLQRGHGLSAEMLADKVLLFVLWYVNVVLILTVLFILLRSLFRLIIDHRSRILGSKFKTKLVLSAIFLSLIPVLILFPFATRLLLDSLEAWFDLPIEEVVDYGQQTANALTEQIEHTNLRDGRRVLEAIADLDLGAVAEHPALKRRLQSLREELEVDYLAVFDGEAFITAIADPRVMGISPTYGRRLTRFVREAIERGEAVRIDDELGIEGRLILAARAAPRAAAGDVEEPRHTVVVIGTVLRQDLAEKSESLLTAYQKYLKLEVQQDDLRATYLLILLMVTLLVILAFTSISMRLARRVTVPIQALAEGTRRIRAGDLDHRVEVAVDDELGVLVEGFNRMTAELKRHRELVERSNRELMEANQQITAERLLLDAVLQNVAAGVLSIDGQGRVLTCNGAALSILHQRDEELIGRPIDEAWADPERGKLLSLLAQDWPAAGELSCQIRLTAGGVWKTLEVKVTTLPEAIGEAGGRVVVLEDLTELIHAQQMATWNEVARRIAHEIKNPLTPIKLTAERLLRKHRQGDPDLGKALEEGVETIVREVATLKNMVDEFSSFARMPRPQPRAVDLESLVGETLSLYDGLKPGVELTSRVAPDARSALFDPGQLKSVLINLLDNAVQAVEPPGNVTVRTARKNGIVELAVADTGCGISDESKDKLFLPYFSTKGRGTGLGLAIVHRIVTDHHASIRVENNRPRGTVFVIEMPAD